MTGMSIIEGIRMRTRQICTSTSSSPTEQVGYFPYPYHYPHLVNVGIPCKNGNEFEQNPRGRLDLLSLPFTLV